MLLALILLACHPDDDRKPIPVEDRPRLDDSAAPEDSGSTDGSDGGGSDGGEDTEPPPPDPAEDCHPDVADWPESWADLEDQVLERVNEERAAGADCGSSGTYAPTGPLAMEDHLRCAARYHSMWMADNDTLAHESPGGDLGDTPWARMSAAGFTGTQIGENVAAGYGSAAAVIEGWMDSDGHCANIMNPSASLIGVGYVRGGSYGHTWTQDFGS